MTERAEWTESRQSAMLPRVGRHTRAVRPVAVVPDDPKDEWVRQLYRQFANQLSAHVLGLTKYDRQWTEDVVQETFIRAWKHADKLDQRPEMLRGWLFVVARRIVIDTHRGRQVRPIEIRGTDIAEDRVGVSDKADSTVDAIVVHEALRRISPDQREAIIETYLKGHTVDEAAVLLGIPPGTVKSRTYHAMRALRRALRARG
ncbi:RNA polymerase sigma-70 factor, ECF subfamily [Actinokineospora alba]|uniref:RNA polymerase sigma-70 factor, ECF subfamily n=1 Tax=Actinokineospora alba TaxID=504798 RepID=A0A1H0TYX5_9PSEU|nr:RNA polymerase sigma-70 factor (ECF subfamily) [Actinokineospora alba]SDJ16576.1 RNA polymerase sigma-70 factor, ECF subfamily [Actinokineospora alba]SDP58975.1 RNA polymerase sigma-70 factor, ECF subfamily [Actinokineospora alba]